MVAEIETLIDAVQSARQDAPGVAAGLSDAQFNQRPSPSEWSVGECFEHLNLTGELYLPVLDAAIENARSRGLTSDGPFSYGFIERWFIKDIDAPIRRRFKAIRELIPPRDLSASAVMTRFDQLQDKLAERLRKADGVDLRRVKVRSKVAPISFTLGTTFNILVAHERRHTWQAREARKRIEIRK